MKPTLGLAAVALLALAGCGQVNRSATLNQFTTSGTTAAATLEQQLAQHGFPGVKVSCSKTLIVNAGASASCSLSGAGVNRTVRFTFKSSTGKIKLSSVKAAS